MKKGIGLFLFLLTVQNLSAGTSSVLVLRARVPASFTVTVQKENGRLVPVVSSNGERFRPKVTMTRKNNHRLVSVVHP